MIRRSFSINIWVFIGILLAIIAFAILATYFVEQQQISSINDNNSSELIAKNSEITQLKAQISGSAASTASTPADSADIDSATKVLQQFDTAFVSNQTVAKEKNLYFLFTSSALSLRSSYLQAQSQAMNMLGTTTTVKSAQIHTPSINPTGLTATAEVSYTDSSNGFARVFQLKKVNGTWQIDDITGTLNSQTVSLVSGRTL